MRSKVFIFSALLAMALSVVAQSYPPLLNTTGGNYNGYSLKLGETAEHYALAPSISKIGNKDILVLIIGASTHGQQAEAMVKQADAQFKDVKFINVCAGGHDIHKWLDLRSKGWTNLKSKVTAQGYNLSEVQAIIFGTDDLKDGGDVRFPQAPQNLSLKIEDFIELAKTQFPNLKQVDLFTRLCGYQLSFTYARFKETSAYHTGWADKFCVENSFKTNHLIKGVWVTDATGYVWTNGEIPIAGTINGVGQIEFQFWFSWMRNGNIHMDTNKNGDEIVADFILTNYSRYAWVN